MGQPQTLPEDHDAQRALEQRSLRNVRALLDKLEAEAQSERRSRNRAAWIAGVVIAAALIGFYTWAFSESASHNGRVLVIPAQQR
jgi:hypothetical protein